MQRWERTYWVVFVANLITALGMMSFLPFFPTYLRELGVEDPASLKLWTGIAFGSAPLSAALMGPIWGALGDRFGRKLMVMRSLLAITIFVGSMGLVSSPAQLIALRLGQGMFSGFLPPSITLVSVAAPHSEQGRVVGSLQASVAAGAIIGPLLGAWIQDRFGLRAVFVLVAVASLLATVLVALFAHEEEGMRATLETFSPTALARDMLKDLRSILARPRIRAAILILFAVQVGLGSTTPQMLLFVEKLGDTGAAAIESHTAWLQTALSSAAFLSTAFWGRLADARGHTRVLLAAALLSALVLFAHAFASSYSVLLASRLVLGLFSTGVNAAAFALAATQTTNQERGGALGAVFSARTLAVSLGAMAGGAVAGAVGMRALFALAGALVLSALAILAGRMWRARR